MRNSYLFLVVILVTFSLSVVSLGCQLQPTATFTQSLSTTYSQTSFTQTLTTSHTTLPTTSYTQTSMMTYTQIPTISHTETPTLSPQDVDNIIKNLPSANIVYNVPTSMTLKETQTIHLKLSLIKTIDELKQEIKECGVQGASVQVSNDIEAVLTAIKSSFDITNITPEKQILSETENEWAWDVKALETGKQRLHLSINIFVGNAQHVIKTFDRDIDVNVSIGSSISDFFASNWQWFCSALIIPLAIWGYHEYQKRRKSHKKQ